MELLTYIQVAGGRRLDTLDDFRRLLDVARKVPDMIDQIIALLEQGIEEKVVFPREALTRLGRFKKP